MSRTSSRMKPAINFKKDVKIMEAMTTQPKNLVSNNENLLYIFCCLVIAVLICISIGHYAFKNGFLTCDHYILNTYLYVILAIVLIILLILLNDRYGIFMSALDYLFYGNYISPFLSLFILIVLIVGLSYAITNIPPENILASNAIWLMLIILISFIIIPCIYFGRITNVLGAAGLGTVAIVIITGLLGYYYGDMIITFDWDYYLGFALVALIIVLFIGMFIPMSVSGRINFIYSTCIIGLIIFVLLLLSYHKNLKQNANKCVDGVMIPNYPLESWSLVIKIVNVLTKLIRILGIRKRRRYSSY